MRVEATSVRAGTAPERSARLIARWVLVSLALLAVLVALVGLAFAGSTARIADGVAIAGVDVGGLTPRGGAAAAGAALRPRRARSRRLHGRRRALPDQGDDARRRGRLGQPRSRPPRARARASVPSAASAACRRASSAPRSRRRSRPTSAALDFKLAGLAEAIDRGHVEAKLVRRGLAIEVVPGQTGRRLDQEAAGARIVRALARLERGAAGGAASPHRSGRGHRRRPRPGRPPGAHRALGAGPASVRGDALEAAALADRGASVAAGRRRDRGRDRRPRRGCLVREAAQDGRASPRRRRASRPSGDASGSCRRRRARPRRAGNGEAHPRGGDVRRDADRRARRPHRRSPSGTTAEAQAMGIERRLGTYTTAQRRHVRPDHEPPARRSSS